MHRAKAPKTAAGIPVKIDNKTLEADVQQIGETTARGVVTVLPLREARLGKGYGGLGHVIDGDGESKVSLGLRRRSV